MAMELTTLHHPIPDLWRLKLEAMSYEIDLALLSAGMHAVDGKEIPRYLSWRYGIMMDDFDED